jgi:hypothetical protein
MLEHEWRLAGPVSISKLCAIKSYVLSNSHGVSSPRVVDLNDGFALLDEVMVQNTVSLLKHSMHSHSLLRSKPDHRIFDFFNLFLRDS